MSKKGVLYFTINGKPFESPEQFVTGKQLRQLGAIPANHDLFLDIKSPWKDDLIQDDESVDLARPGKERFISQVVAFTLIANGSKKTWNQRTISFEQLVELTLGRYDSSARKVYAVYYDAGLPPKVKGSLVKGDVLHLTNNMIFNVDESNQS